MRCPWHSGWAWWSHRHRRRPRPLRRGTSADGRTDHERRDVVARQKRWPRPSGPAGTWRSCRCAPRAARCTRHRTANSKRGSTCAPYALGSTARGRGHRRERGQRLGAAAHRRTARRCHPRRGRRQGERGVVRRCRRLRGHRHPHRGHLDRVRRLGMGEAVGDAGPRGDHRGAARSTIADEYGGQIDVNYSAPA